MTIPVRQSTAFELSIGPVLDADGVAVTDCVVGDFKIKKTTGNYAALNGSATLTHVSAGTYDLVLTTSDLDTVGLATISIDDTVNACAPVRLQVIEEAVYDALYAASAPGYLQPTTAGRTLDVSAGGEAGVDWANIGSPTTTVNLSGTTIATTQKVDVVASGTVNDASATTTSFKTTLTDADNFWNDAQLIFTSGALAGESRLILQFQNTNGVITFDEALTSAPANGVSFVIKAVHAHTRSQITSSVWTNGSRTLTTLDEDSTTLDLDATIRAAVGLASADLDTQLTAIDDYIDTEVAAILAAVDTEVAAIKAKTDNLPASPAAVGSAMTLTSAYDIYTAEIQLTIDEANTQDEYTIQWLKNGVAQTSGITSPTLQVVKRADGTDLIASTTPSQIGSTGVYKKDATTTSRVTAGEAVIAIVTATIDGSTRTWRKLLGRDSTA